MSPLHKFMLQYALWVALMPSAAVMVTFGGLCAWECAAGPWFTVFFGPALAATLWVISATWFWSRSSQMLPKEMRSAKRFIVSSLLWAPILAATTMYVVYKITQSLFRFAGL